MKKIYQFLMICLSLGVALDSFGQAQERKTKKMDFPKGTAPHVEKAPPSCAQTLNYDTENVSRVSFGTGMWSAMIFFDQSDLAFFEDTSKFVGARVHISSETDNGQSAYDSVIVEMYEGSEVTSGGNLIVGDSALYSKNVTDDIAADGWNEFYFDSALAINRDTTYVLRVVIYQTVAAADGAFPMGVAAGPEVDGRGAWWETTTNSGQLSEGNADFDYNWNLRLCVEGGKIIPKYNVTAKDPGSDFASYKVIPFKQASFQGFNITGTVENNGSEALSSVNTTYTVLPNNASSDQEVTNVNGFSSKDVAFTEPFVPFDTGVYAIQFDVDIDSTDFYPRDNSITSKAFIVDESKYSSVITAGTGFFAQNGFTDVTYANLFDIFTPDTLKQMEILVSGTAPGARFYGFCAKWDELQQNIFGDTIFTDTLTSFAGISDDIDSTFYLHFREHQELVEGLYIVGLVEIEGGLRSGIQGSNTDYIDGRSFVTAAERPNWIPSEDFWDGGDGYYYGITINFGKFEETTGIEDQLTSDFKIYPNPADNQVSIILGENNSQLNNLKVELLDLAGRTLISKEGISNSSNVELELDNLSSGAYMVRLSNGSKNYIKKLIVN